MLGCGKEKTFPPVPCSGDRASFILETLELSASARIFSKCVSSRGWIPREQSSAAAASIFASGCWGLSGFEGIGRGGLGLMAGRSAAPSPAQVRELFKALLREGRKFSNYNVREYVKRRTVDGFHENRDASDPAAVAAAYEYGVKQLEIAKRQAVVYNLYAPKVKSIMDLKIKPSRA